jgi:hypothetical protein
MNRYIYLIICVPMLVFGYKFTEFMLVFVKISGGFQVSLEAAHSLLDALQC